MFSFYKLVEAVERIEVKESGVVKLPDGSGFFTGTVGKPKKKKKRVSESELVETYLSYVQDSEIQEFGWQDIKQGGIKVKNYLDKERTMDPAAQRRIATAKIGDIGFEQKVRDNQRKLVADRQRRLARALQSPYQRPVGATPA